MKIQCATVCHANHTLDRPMDARGLETAKYYIFEVQTFLHEFKRSETYENVL